jgi:hypothetical protein
MQKSCHLCAVSGAVKYIVKVLCFCSIKLNTLIRFSSLLAQVFTYLLMPWAKFMLSLWPIQGQLFNGKISDFCPLRVFFNHDSTVQISKMVCRTNTASVPFQGQYHTWRLNIRQISYSQYMQCLLKDFLLIQNP